MCQFDLPETCPTCTAAASGFPADSRLLRPEKIITALHVDSGHTSAQQSERERVDSEECAMGKKVSLIRRFSDVMFVDCPPFDKAPHFSDVSDLIRP